MIFLYLQFLYNNIKLNIKINPITYNIAEIKNSYLYKMIMVPTEK